MVLAGSSRRSSAQLFSSRGLVGRMPGETMRVLVSHQEAAATSDLFHGMKRLRKLRQMTAFVPVDRHGRSFSAGRKLVDVGGAMLLLPPFLLRGKLATEVDRVVHVDRGRVAEAEGILGDVERVAPDIAETAEPVIPVPTPSLGADLGAVSLERRRAGPQIPVQRGRDVLAGQGDLRIGVVRGRPVGPGVHFPHLADHAGFVPLANVAHPLHGVPLVSHHGLHLVLVIGLLQGAGLPDVVRERLLRLHRDPALHRGEGGRKMGVVRRADDDEIEFLAVGVKELAEILVAFRLWKPLEPFRAGHLVDVGDGDHVVIIDIVEAGFRDPTAADEGDIQFVVGAFDVGAQERERLGSGERRGGRGSLSGKCVGYCWSWFVLGIEQDFFSQRKLFPSMMSSLCRFSFGSGGATATGRQQTSKRQDPRPGGASSEGWAFRPRGKDVHDPGLDDRLPAPGLLVPK